MSWVDPLSFLAQHALAMLVVAGSAWIFGRAAIRRWAGRFEGAEREVVATILGVGLIAQALFVLGVVGLLNPPAILVTLVLAHASCWRVWREVVTAARWRRRWLVPVLGFGALAAPMALLSLYPPTGFDATVYHLPYVRHFLDAGRLVFVDTLRYPVFPQVGEVGFVLGFVLAGDVTAQHTQVLAALLTAGLLLVWGRSAGTHGGWWAASLWMGVPLVVWIGSQAYVDVTLTLFAASSAFAWERWRRDRADIWLVLSGTFAGFAAGTKYLGLFFVAALAAAAVADAVGHRRVRTLGLFLAAALVAMGPWYARIVLHTGNPVFPFYPEVFGANDWTEIDDRMVGAAAGDRLSAVATVGGVRAVSGVGFLLATPWLGVFDRDVFGGQAPLTPWYLVLLPIGLPIALWVSAANRWRTLLVLGYCVCWLASAPDLRYLLPILPILHIVLASGLDRLVAPLRNRWRLGLVFTLALALPGWVYGTYKLQQRGPVPTTAAQRTTYLDDHVKGHKLIRALNEIQGRDHDLYGLLVEHLTYFADGRFRGDHFGPAAYREVLETLHDGDQLLEVLRRQGVCFFLNRDMPKWRLPPDDELGPRFRRIGTQGSFNLFALAIPECRRSSPRSDAGRDVVGPAREQDDGPGDDGRAGRHAPSKRATGESRDTSP